MTVLRRLLGSLVLALTVASCGGGGGGEDGGGGGDPVTTALQVEAYIARSIEHDGYTGITWSVSVLRDGVAMNDAVVNVNGTVVPREVGFIDGWYPLYDYDTPSANYVPGQTYTVTVTQGGQTVSDSVVAPGGFTIGAAGESVAWASNGNVATLDVRHLFGATTWYTPSVRPSGLTSPQSVPSTAYPPGDTYTLVAVVQRVKDRDFGTLHGLDSSFVVQDAIERRFDK